MCFQREVVFSRGGLLSRGCVPTSLAWLWMPPHLQLIGVTCCCLCPVTAVIIGQGLPSPTVLFLTCISVLFSIYSVIVCVKWAENTVFSPLRRRWMSRGVRLRAQTLIIFTTFKSNCQFTSSRPTNALSGLDIVTKQNEALSLLVFLCVRVKDGKANVPVQAGSVANQNGPLWNKISP